MHLLAIVPCRWLFHGNWRLGFICRIDIVCGDGLFIGIVLVLSQRFTLASKYQLQLSGRYSSAYRNLIYYQKSSANLSASISRKLFSENASLRLGISDIFKTQRSYTLVDFGSLNYSDLGTFESRRLSLNFSWRFGNTKVRQTIDRDQGNAEEKGRSGG
ncbi:MAG: hypothetical protein EOO38_26195 [Cytophagaceae bacterium]|nr:MAG: hypothetical protein EOO38_26195 [Cytophagaceae bacterium]